MIYKQLNEKETNVSHLFGFSWFCGVDGFIWQGVASSPSHWLPLHMHGGRANIINIHADHRDWYCWNVKANISLMPVILLIINCCFLLTKWYLYMLNRESVTMRSQWERIESFPLSWKTQSHCSLPSHTQDCKLQLFHGGTKFKFQRAFQWVYIEAKIDTNFLRFQSLFLEHL